MDMIGARLADAGWRQGVWWNTRLFAGVLLVVAIVPLLWPSLPPLLDLPGHMARYRVQLGLAESPWLQRYFAFEWAAVGNLGVDLLVQLLGPVLGLEPAVKLITLAIPALFVAGALVVAREAHGHLPPTAAMAVPLAYSAPFQYGFLNYMLAVSLALLAFALWLKLGRSGRQGARAILFAPLSLLLYFTHIYGWGVLGLLCFGAEAVRAHDQRGRTWPVAAWQAARSCLVLAAPLVPLLMAAKGAGAGSVQGWMDLRVKFEWLLSPLRDRWKLLDFPAGMLCFALILFARIHPKLHFSRTIAGGALLLAAACLLLPFQLLNSALADMRLLPVALVLGLLAIDSTDRRLGRKVALFAVAFAAVKMTGTTASFAIAAERQEERLAQIAELPQGTRLAALVGSQCEQPWSLVRDGHLGSMITVSRDGFSNDQWSGPGINLLRVKYQPPGRFASDPLQTVQPSGCVLTWTVDQALAAFPREAFDYLWLLDTEAPDPALLRGLEPVSAINGARLYRVVSAANAAGIAR